MIYPVTMADAAQPGNIPLTIERAAAYVNGKFAWTQAQLEQRRWLIRISVTGDPGQAARARCIDVERGDATPADVPAFVRHRTELGHHDATVYSDRNDLPAILAALHAAGGLAPRHWIATLDGRAWTPPELSAEIAAAEHVTLPPHRIWAVQYGQFPPGYDLSLVYGEQDFAGPW